jgi:predicted SprT family Zn-dependent metalloprotease
MPLTKTSFEALRDYVPHGSFELVMPIILQHKVHLIVARDRASKNGDFRNAYYDKNHRITVNGGLNQYAFLITLLHELAHLLAFEQYGFRIAPHGREWKKAFGELLQIFVNHHIFPADIQAELHKTLHNPAATTCGEVELQRVLMRYDAKKPGVCTVEQLAPGTMFYYDGELYERQQVLRKRIRCLQVRTRLPYNFSPLCEVSIFN